MTHTQQTRSATWLWLGIIAVLGALLALDLYFHGKVWQLLQRFKSANNSTLPAEQRTIGQAHRTDVTFLS